MWAQVVRNGPLPTPLPLFPSDNWWNADITSAPIDGSNATYKGTISGVGLHPDFGAEGEFEPTIYGIPFISVPGTQPLVPVTWTAYGHQSDDAGPCQPPGYPIPDEAKTQSKWIEGGHPGDVDPESEEGEGDRHMLIVDRDNHILYELFRTFWNSVSGEWEADSGAVFPLDYNKRRPDTWTSADAAGLAILPGLVRRDEAYGSEPIRHAFRVTVDGVCGYVFPASHLANTGCPNGPPLGARLRLQSGKNITGYPAHIQRIFQAMKTYGLIVTDTGSDMYITGTYDPDWDNDELNPYFDDLTIADFDFIQVGWTPPNYPILPEGDWCPWHPVPREQLPVYMLRALESQSYTPPAPACGGGFYTDVPCPANQYSAWIEELRDRGIVSACQAGQYCPKNAVTHAELAMALVKAKHVVGYTPPVCTNPAPFTDFTCSHDFADWIMQAKAENLLAGCSATRFCPDESVTRVQLEKALAASF